MQKAKRSAGINGKSLQGGIEPPLRGLTPLNMGHPSQPLPMQHPTLHFCNPAAKPWLRHNVSGVEIGSSKKTDRPNNDMVLG